MFSSPCSLLPAPGTLYPAPYADFPMPRRAAPRSAALLCKSGIRPNPPVSSFRLEVRTSARSDAYSTCTRTSTDRTAERPSPVVGSPEPW